MYDPAFFHRVTMAIHEDNLRQAAARYRVQQEPVVWPARPAPRLGLLRRRLGQALWRAVPARLSSRQ